jgi:glucosamine-phosphate N-acetyltransferase
MESTNTNQGSEITIREAKNEDIDRICEIYSQHFGYTESAPRQWWNILQDTNIHYIVAERNNHIIGVASLITINKLIRSGNRMALIEDVAVDNDARGLGVGKLMIERLKQLAIEKSCYKTVLNCSRENVGFYEKCGFYEKEVQMRWDRPAKDN